MDAPGDLIRAARARHGISQERLARRAGTTQAAISRIEHGEEEITWGRLVRLLAVLGEEPVLGSRPRPARYRAGDLLSDRAQTPATRLEGAFNFNSFTSKLAAAGREAKAREPEAKACEPEAKAREREAKAREREAKAREREAKGREREAKARER